MSITALRDDYGDIIGYLLIGTDNSVRKHVELGAERGDGRRGKGQSREIRFSLQHEPRAAHAAQRDPRLRPAHGIRHAGADGLAEAKLDQILKAGWYLLELINEILDLALIESGKLTLSLEPISLAEVMLECQAMIEPQAQKRGIGMTFPRFEIPLLRQGRPDPGEAGPDQPAVQRDQVQQGRTERSSSSASLSAAGRDPHLRPDTGAGLTPEQLAQLFQPFNRLGKEASVEEGTGIGLVVTKRLVELMGGVIGVESAVGVGSVFWIELNLTTAPQLVAAGAEPAALSRPQSCSRRAAAHAALCRRQSGQPGCWSRISSRAAPTCAC